MGALIPVPPVWLIALALIAAVLVSLEVGYRLSHMWGRTSNVSALQASVLGLTSLLLAFSYSVAQSHFDERRLLVVKESNAIGTFYLRTEYLPEPSRTSVRALLDEYIEARIYATEEFRNPERQQELIQKSARIQERMWRILAVESKKLEAPILLLLNYGANEMFDVAAQRWAAGNTVLPALVLLLILTVICASSFLLGYQPEGKGRNYLQWTIFTVVMAMMIVALLNLDRPSVGVITTNIQPLVDLQRSFRAGSVGAP
jgi:hypothetical protein